MTECAPQNTSLERILARFLTLGLHVRQLRHVASVACQIKNI